MVRSLIFTKRDRGEADELVVFFSEEHGRLRGVAKNAKKSIIRFGGHLEPFCLVDLVLRARRRDELVWIEESSLIRGYDGLRRDPEKAALASHMLEVASVLSPEGQADPPLFAFLVDFLGLLEAGETNLVLFLIDEIVLLGLLGHQPNFHDCPVCSQPLEVGTSGFFSNQYGGAVHPSCVDDREGLIPMSADTLAVVRRGMNLERTAAGRLRLGRKGLSELHGALSGFVRHLRGGELNSLIYMEKINLWPE